MNSLEPTDRRRWAALGALWHIPRRSHDRQHHPQHRYPDPCPRPAGDHRRPAMDHQRIHIGVRRLAHHGRWTRREIRSPSDTSDRPHLVRSRVSLRCPLSHVVAADRLENSDGGSRRTGHAGDAVTCRLDVRPARERPGDRNLVCNRRTGNRDRPRSRWRTTRTFQLGKRLLDKRPTGRRCDRRDGFSCAPGKRNHEGFVRHPRAPVVRRRTGFDRGCPHPGKPSRMVVARHASGDRQRNSTSRCIHLVGAAGLGANDRRAHLHQSSVQHLQCHLGRNILRPFRSSLHVHAIPPISSWLRSIGRRRRCSSVCDSDGDCRLQQRSYGRPIRRAQFDRDRSRSHVRGTVGPVDRSR